MQRPDEAKRHAIMDAAASLFASRPYHEVRIEDVAEAAHVGKGTLYVYFKSKDDLYGALVYEAFAQLVERLRHRAEDATDTQDTWRTLEAVVRELVLWAKQFPDFFHLMRAEESDRNRPRLREKRRELGRLIEQIIRRGVRAGQIDDPRPALTAQFVPACVRTAIRHGPSGLDTEEIVAHILRVLGGGIDRRTA